MQKILNLPPIEVEIEDLDGNIIKLTARKLPAEEANKINKIVDNQSPVGDKATEQMAVIFGGKKEDYANIDIRVLNGAINYFNTQFSNPTK